VTEVDAPPLEFDAGLVGFPEARRFVLADAGGGAFELRALDDESADFVVVAPGPFFPDYAPMIDDATADRLALQSADDALVLLVVTLGSRPQDATANLLAPLVVNTRTRRGAQVILENQPYPLRAPLVAGSAT
jgi:flagellar assembly factor FliW